MNLSLFLLCHYPSIYTDGTANAVQLGVQLINGLIYQGNNAGNFLPDDYLQMLIYMPKEGNIYLEKNKEKDKKKELHVKHLQI